MATYISNRNSDGKTDENGHFRFPLKMVEGNILEGFELQPQESSMILNITPGEIRIPYSDYAYAAWSNATATATIDPAPSSGSRIDRVVAYIDRAMTFAASTVNHPNGLKFMVVKGDASATPAAKSDSAVSAAVSNNPWAELGRVVVQTSVSKILPENISYEHRKPVNLSVGVRKLVDQNSKVYDLTILEYGESIPTSENPQIVIFTRKSE